MKNKIIVATGLFALALLVGCDKAEDTSAPSATAAPAAAESAAPVAAPAPAAAEPASK